MPVLLGIMMLVIASCDQGNTIDSTSNEPGSQENNATWARSVNAGSSNSTFYSVAVDGSGNVYAAGYIDGNGTYTFGNGVSVQATNDLGNNIVLVKYAPDGTAQWARSVSAPSFHSAFTSVAVDGSGNVYAAGFIYGSYTYTYTFGNGVSVQATNSSGNTIVLVKYAPDGNAQWARSVSGPNKSSFYSVAVDGSGDVYAAGFIEGTGTYTFGTGVSAKGTYYGYNTVLVKYDPNGTAQWARSVSEGSSNSTFYSVAVDGAGNVYAAGSIRGTGTYTFGTGVSANGTYSYDNIVLVKYAPDSTAQWARTVSSGSSSSCFNSVAVDGSGNVYAAGSIRGTGTYTFGTGVSANGTYSYDNIVLVKYAPDSTAQWARTVSSGSSSSCFNSVAVDGAGNVYAAGYIDKYGSFIFGNGVSTKGTYDTSIVLLKYASDGTAQWARSVSSGPNYSYFYSVAVDGSGNVCAAGYIVGTRTYTFGNGVSTQGTYSAYNAVLVKYSSVQ